MLPFLKPKTVAGLIISKRKPDASIEESHSEDNADHAIDAASDDLIRAIHAKDTKSVTSALKAIKELVFENHSDDGSFDSQNIKAAPEAKE